MAIPEEEPNTGAPGWVVTYADMMTLLLAFFVLLFSISEIKEERGNAMMQSLQRTFGRDDAGQPREADAPADSPLAELLRAGRRQRLQMLHDGSKTRLLANTPGTPRPSEPLLTATETPSQGWIAFAENSAELGAAARQRLEQLARQLAAEPQAIDIRGQVSGVAGSGQGAYRSPWDLAYARCRSTLEYLVSQGIAPQRLRLSVTPPLDNADGASPPSMASGSRVEVAWRSSPAPVEQAAQPATVLPPRR